MKNKNAMRGRYVCFGALVLCSMVIILSRLHTYDEPLERDITSYEIIGNELLKGRSLYSGLWDHKPPAVHVTYAVAIALTGYGERSVYILGVLAAVLTLLGIYNAGKGLAGNSTGGLWAAIFWTAISGDLHLQANQPNVEVFVNASLVWAFAMMLRSDGRSAALPRWFWIGVMFAVGSLYKQTVVVPAVLLSLVHIACAAPGEGGRRKAALQIAVAGLAGAGAWCLVMATFLLRGALDDFIYAAFTFNRHYSGSVCSNLARSFAPARLWPQALRFTWPVGLLSLAAGLHEIIRGERRRWMLFAALCASAHIMMAMPGRFFPHYYQYWLPILALGGGSALGLVAAYLRTGKYMVAHALGVVAAAMLLRHEIPFYMLPAEEWSRQKYYRSNEDFIGAKRCAGEINGMLSQNEQFYEWGSDTGLYFYSRRRPPAAVFYHYALLFGPGGASLEKRLLAQLDAAKPELFVVNVHEPITNNIHTWMRSRYVACIGKPHCNGFAFFVRQGGGLERRLMAGSVSPGLPPGNAVRGGG